MKKLNKKVTSIIAGLVAVVVAIVSIFMVSTNTMTNFSKERDSEFLNKQIDKIEENLIDNGYAANKVASYSQDNVGIIVYETSTEYDEGIMIVHKNNQVIAIVGASGYYDDISVEVDLATVASDGILVKGKELEEVKDGLLVGVTEQESENTVYGYETGCAVIMNKEAAYMLNGEVGI